MLERSITVVRGLLKRYGPTSVKKVLWDQEFSGRHWDFIDNTADDCVYPQLEKHARKGSILDLGCGPGNTANELAAGAYDTYLGVDISEAALEKGRQRTKANGRAGKNSFECGDFINYEPKRAFDVILFRESMYHVPVEKVCPMLNRYAKYLASDGRFIVRMDTYGPDGKKKSRLDAMITLFKKEFDVIEHKEYSTPGPTVIVFRPKATAASK